MKSILFVVATLATTFTLAASVSAHVVVKPGDVTTGAFQTFTMGVPNEKGGNVIMVKLLIPEGVTSVTPTVKQGWTIETEKSGEGETAVVKSITWKNGTVGTGLRDDFTFSAKTPDTATELQWKAYETYDNGLTVAWDKSATEQPKKADGKPDFSKSGPFSVTKVAAKPAATAKSAEASEGMDTLARTMSGAALAVGLVSFAIATNRKKK